MQNKQFELELIEHELQTLRESRVMLMKLLNKKGASDERNTILSETLELNRSREQELLSERAKIQETTSTRGNIGLTGVTTDNENKV